MRNCISSGVPYSFVWLIPPFVRVPPHSEGGNPARLPLIEPATATPLRVHHGVDRGIYFYLQPTGLHVENLPPGQQVKVHNSPCPPVNPLDRTLSLPAVEPARVCVRRGVRKDRRA